MDIIRQIYCGDYRPAEKGEIESKEYQEARDLAYKAYTEFEDLLSQEQKVKFEQLMDLHLDVFLCGNEVAFIQGARAGAQMLLDLLAGSL